jgi:hypothetical protein
MYRQSLRLRTVRNDQSICFFPILLVDTFEPVIQEEARHTLLSATWLAAERRRLPPLKRIWFEARVAAVRVFLGWERISLARGVDDRDAAKADNNFTVTGSKSLTEEDLGVTELFRLCPQENDRRFSGYDSCLRRPTTMPALVRLAMRAMTLASCIRPAAWQK